jgi:hypothetical protein
VAADPPDPGDRPRRVDRFVWGAVALIVLGVVVLVVMALTEPTATETVIRRTSVPAPVLAELRTIPPATFDSVGVNGGSVIPLIAPATLTGQPQLTSAGKPEVLYVGAEFCSYCAAERWPLVVALSRFGRFSHLAEMQSSGTSAFPSIQTFSFEGSRYTSAYLTFVAVEEYSDVIGSTGSYTRIASLTPAEQAVFRRDDPRGIPGGSPDLKTLPFVDIANRMVTSTSAFTPALLQNLSRDAVASALADPSASLTPPGSSTPAGSNASSGPASPGKQLSPTGIAAQSIVAAANELTAGICSATGQQPADVCATTGVRAADAVLGLS